jgi:hypothetical protein
MKFDAAIVGNDKRLSAARGGDELNALPADGQETGLVA